MALNNSKPFEPITPKLISPSTQKLINSSSQKLIISLTQKLINPLTQKLINSLAPKIINSLTQNPNFFIFILQYASNFHAVLAKILAKKQVNVYHFQPFMSLTLSVFKNKTCILHHFTFLVWLEVRFLSSPNTPILPLKTHFSVDILPFSAMFLMALNDFIYTIAVYIHAFRLAFFCI